MNSDSKQRESLKPLMASFLNIIVKQACPELDEKFGDNVMNALQKECEKWENENGILGEM